MKETLKELKGFGNNPPCSFLMQNKKIYKKMKRDFMGWEAASKQSPKVHFTVENRTFLLDFNNLDPYNIRLVHP